MLSHALRRPHRMTVAEFRDWQPPEGLADRRWQLVDGEPVCMAPPSADHGALHSEATFLLSAHLRAHRPGCRVLITPGVIPALQSTTNERVPDLGVTCSPVRDRRRMIDPVLLIEILSPSNEADTRANVWAYCTIPSVQEVLLFYSTSIEAELLRRDAEGRWPDAPTIIRADDQLRLETISFEARLRDFYVTTSLIEAAQQDDE
jgi:Uma2 family endonuclease